MDSFIFFSSRRRHTRYWRDWSSDVCSSDLDVRLLLEGRDDCFQTLLELAAVLRPGQERAHVERVDLGALEGVGHLALLNLEGEALGNRRLADAGVAEDRKSVV